MSIVYRFDVLEKLKEKGYSTYKIRKEKIFSEGTLQKFRTGEMISPDKFNMVCKLLNCQPGDIVEYIPDEEES